jgi:hypothetical protein
MAGDVALGAAWGAVAGDVGAKRRQDDQQTIHDANATAYRIQRSDHRLLINRPVTDPARIGIIR